MGGPRALTTSSEGWRWETRVEGAIVEIEFLCERADQPQEAIVTPIGCTRLTAVNLRGTGFVTEDFEWVELAGKLPDGATVTDRVRFAGLEGYLMSKIHVAWRRGLAKDYYDLVYTLLYNRLGGPSKQQTLWRSASFATASTFRAAPGRRSALGSQARPIAVRGPTPIRRCKPSRASITPKLARTPLAP